MAMMVMRHAKIKTAGALTGLQNENNRTAERYNNSVDLSRSDQNIWLERCDDFNSAVKQVIADNNIELSERTGKQAPILAISSVYTASPEWFAENPQKTHEDFFRDCLKWHEKHYGKVISAVIHNDETTPHMHVVSVPIIQTPKRENYYIDKETKREVKVNTDEWKQAKEKGTLFRKQRHMVDGNGKKIMRTALNGASALGNRIQLSKQQTLVVEQVGKKYGIERGKIRVDDEERKQHLTAQEYKTKKLDKEINDKTAEIDTLKQTAIKGKETVEILKKQAVEAKQERDSMTTQVNHIESKIKVMLKQKKAIQNEIQALQTKQENAAEITAEIELDENLLNALVDEINKVQRDYPDVYNRVIDRLDNMIAQQGYGDNDGEHDDDGLR